MQPYQEASQAARRQGEAPAKFAEGIIGTAVIGSGIISKVLPFLNKYIPENLARKGLDQIDRRFGTFIDKAMENGKSFDEVREFIKGKISEEEKSEGAKETRGIIEKYSPELHQFLDQEIRKGRTPHQAGAIAQLEGKFSSAIKQMEKDHKVPFSAILDSVFGEGVQSNPGSSQSPQQTIQGSQGMGPGAQQLMGLLQQLKQARGIQ